MPYKPYTPAEVDRSYAYKYAWTSATCSVALLPLYLYGVTGGFTGLIVGGAVGGVLASTLTGRTDDYFRSLCSVGHRWAMFALASYMFVGWMAWTIDKAAPPGLGMLLGTPPKPGSATSVFFDGHLAAIILALVYHAGYGVQWARDHFGSKDE